MHDFEFLFECDFSVDHPGPGSVVDISRIYCHWLFLGSEKKWDPGKLKLGQCSVEALPVDHRRLSIGHVSEIRNNSTESDCQVLAWLSKCDVGTYGTNVPDQT